MSLSKRLWDEVHANDDPDDYDDDPRAGCDHVYRETSTAPLGVTCVKCGHFVGAWET